MGGEGWFLCVSTGGPWQVFRDVPYILMRLTWDKIFQCFAALHVLFVYVVVQTLLSGSSRLSGCTTRPHPVLHSISRPVASPGQPALSRPRALTRRRCPPVRNAHPPCPRPLSLSFRGDGIRYGFSGRCF